jgi:hypothetical protein
MKRVSNVFWLADTNYRIDLDNDTVRAMVQSGDLDSLVAADQVSRNVVLQWDKSDGHCSSNEPWM